MEKNEELNYEEMLKMDAESFRDLIVKRVEVVHREKLLEEMIEHEGKTGSFQQTVTREITPEEQVVFNIFIKDKSAEAVSFLSRMKNLLDENSPEESKDLVMEAILAKAASDFARK